VSAALAASLLGCAGAFNSRKAPATATPPSAETLARGAYVARVANCLSCHTPPGAEPFSGGRALATDFGVFYSPNITPDIETGLGGWTEEAFARAVRRGVRKDGALLYPLMPLESYAHMTDEDVHALWLYLQSVPPVRRAAPAHDLSFPFNLRIALRGWRIAHFDLAPYAPAPEKSEEWNRGAYLAEALAHCAACHSPRGRAGGIIEGERFTGGDVEDWRAPDISGGPSSRVADWSEEQLAAFLRTGEAEGLVAAGPMAEVVQNGLSHLTDADARAIAVYLKDLPGARGAGQKASTRRAHAGR
jgi:mono/diheme cytochrome c family protein